MLIMFECRDNINICVSTVSEPSPLPFALHIRPENKTALSIHLSRVCGSSFSTDSKCANEIFIWIRCSFVCLEAKAKVKVERNESMCDYFV